ncbi:MAG: hypothetical protein ACMG6E_05465 [Candidatus Roizmanbacteria bacterium]
MASRISSVVAVHDTSSRSVMELATSDAQPLKQVDRVDLQRCSIASVKANSIFENKIYVLISTLLALFYLFDVLIGMFLVNRLYE